MFPKKLGGAAPEGLSDRRTTQERQKGARAACCLFHPLLSPRTMCRREAHFAQNRHRWEDLPSEGTGKGKFQEAGQKLVSGWKPEQAITRKVVKKSRRRETAKSVKQRC